jgi:hypothetical protein
MRSLRVCRSTNGYRRADAHPQEQLPKNSKQTSGSTAHSIHTDRTLAGSRFVQQTPAKHLRVAHPAPHQLDHAHSDRFAPAGVAIGQIKRLADLVECRRHGVRHIGFEDRLISQERKNGAHEFGLRVTISARTNDSRRGYSIFSLLFVNLYCITAL